MYLRFCYLFGELKMMYLHTSAQRADGTRDSFLTQRLESKESPLWWQDRGLSFTASGYGKRIPTLYMVRYMGKWRRVYCCIYSNAGTCYIGKLADGLIIGELTS
jgi:hypothetical protein